MKVTIAKKLILALIISVGFLSTAHSQSKYNKNIPDQAHNQMNAYLRYGISTFAFTPTGGWIIVAKNGRSFARNIPEACNKKVKELISKGHKVEHVAFSNQSTNSWIIVTDKATFSRNIPNDCYERIKKYEAQGKKIKMVAFPNKKGVSNSWVIITKDGKFAARNIDDECYQIIRNLSQAPYKGGRPLRKIDFVAFSPQGGFAITADDYHISMNIAGDCLGKMNEYRKAKNKISIIAFTPNGKGWSIISNNKTTRSINDPIRTFESNVGGQSIWQTMRDSAITGLSVAMVIDGKVAWSTSYGFLAAGDRNKAAHPESIFQAASISKVLAAIGAYKMVDQRRVGLDEDLQRGKLATPIPIHPCFRNTGTTRNINIRNILNHQSGIDGNDAIFSGRGCNVQEGGYRGYPNSTRVTSLPEIDEIVYGGGSKANTRPVTITHRPQTGGGSNYSGPGFSVLQKLTEELTGQKYASWMKSNVLDLLQMNKSAFTTNPERMYHSKELTWGFQSGNVRNRYPEYAAAGLYSNVEDLSNVVIMLNNNGLFGNRRLLSSQNARLLTQGTGLNTSRREIVSTKDVYYCHGGINRGYRSFLIGFPNIQNNTKGIKNAGIIVMYSGSSSAVRFQVINSIIRAYDLDR